MLTGFVILWKYNARSRWQKFTWQQRRLSLSAACALFGYLLVVNEFLATNYAKNHIFTPIYGYQVAANYKDFLSSAIRQNRWKLVYFNCLARMLSVGAKTKAFQLNFNLFRHSMISTRFTLSKNHKIHYQIAQKRSLFKCLTTKKNIY